MNALQRKEGIDLTTRIAGRVPYSQMQKNIYLRNMQSELVERNVNFNVRANIATLIRLLKDDEGDPDTFKSKMDILSIECDSLRL